MPALATEHPRAVDNARELVTENGRLRSELERLRVENWRLRGEVSDLRMTLDAYTARLGSTAAYGPLEMTAGTCVGPRRRPGPDRRR